ncbi:aminodeoxychorismate synthase component I [Gilliamella apicola]|uniref:Aminodeoxychorismate synthase component I n=1 Tax=Gilliamella apicola TaxID=1196095 RepID=A0A2V4E425_9GAMM|nr:aminodeoxychorismate synthase component I [Gilliamella apicola]PXZ05606.1 aminodeoxychorismate synthase component I [Gilliamella apicola]
MKIYFDFEGQHKYFCDPIKIIKSSDHCSIKKDIEEIEAFIQQGYYACGYLAYESAMGFNESNKTKILPTSNQDLPLLLFGIFEDYTTISNNEQYIPQSLKLSSDTNIDEYQQKISYIRAQIESGNTYQTNFTIQFNAPFNGNPKDYYHFLQKNNRANYCAYIEFEKYHILSISPELFFKLEDRTISTKPMKGTVARGLNNNQDKQQIKSLMSEKNLAENMMIVDLLRNDLSKISEPGSVTVPHLFTAEKYPTVWQLTSTIQGNLKENVNLYQIFQALFPCGSITGAPKSSTMQIISNIENSARGVYCGTIGYIEPSMKKAVFNIPIRTLTIHNQQLNYGVGGGITWDSTADDEYNEILAKTAILNRTLSTPKYIIETLLLEDGKLVLLDMHLDRLLASATYFDFACNVQTIKQKLTDLAKTYFSGKYKIRLLQPKNGQPAISIDLLTNPIVIDKLAWAEKCVDKENVFLYHKTTNRQHFPQLAAGQEYINYNQYDEITEFVNGNIALLINDKWLTPAITSGLLAGTMRQNYLNNHQLIEKKIIKKDILQADKIAFINSVRGWVEIENQLLNKLKQQLL